MGCRRLLAISVFLRVPNLRIFIRISFSSSLTRALIITPPSKTITAGPVTITYQSEASDPPGNITFWLGHVGGVGGFFQLTNGVEPSTKPVQLQLDLFEQTGDGEQWQFSAGPATERVDGIFASSDPVTIVSASSVSQSASASSSSSVSASSTASTTSNSSPDTSTPSPSASAPNSSSIASKSSPSVGLIVGVTLAAAIVLAIIFLLAFLYLRRRRRLAHSLTPIDPSPSFISHSAFASSPSAADIAQAKIEPYLMTPVSANTSDISRSPSDAQPPPIPALGSKAALARQEYLTNQLREVQSQLQALHAPVSPPPARSPPKSPSSAGLSNTHTDGTESGLAEAREQNAALEQRIRELEGQLQSRWALGLSDEPPPGYME
ncbi:F-box domain-containing protein [Favolaschia claudopus]|uniref:F-box domain-containing protein n=1 Tax=Favolaschia claudopus TaxID=2862362 RepID=A0AAW0DW60_9AGAR